VQGAITEKNTEGSGENDVYKDREKDDSAHGEEYGPNPARVPTAGALDDVGNEIPILVFPEYAGH